MASIRNYDRVPTTAPSQNGRKVGRPPIPEDEALSCIVRLALTETEYDAFLAFRKRNPLSKGESAAGRKIFVERLMADKLLK